LYDEVSLQRVLDMTADWTLEEREMLRNKVASLQYFFFICIIQHRSISKLGTIPKIAFLSIKSSTFPFMQNPFGLEASSMG